MASASSVKVLRGGRAPTDARADALRALALDAAQQVNSGLPAAPMGMAETAVALCTGHLRRNPAKPHRPDRDRFLLSNGRASMLPWELPHLAGYEPPIEEIKSFRKLHSKTAVSTGPIGQGVGNAVGFALAEKMLARERNGPGHGSVAAPA
jgi:transketolase